MGRYTGPKNKLSRREGKDLFGNGGEALQRRLRQPPGEHGRRRSRQSDYARQLREKQKVKRMYGVRERQFRRLFNRARRSSDPTGVALLKLLERRLDNVLYRLGLARTRPQARQFVTHGHVSVDGRRVGSPSYLVEPGQVVTLDESVRQTPDVRELQENGPPLPAWLNSQNGTGRVLRHPEWEELDPDVDERLIIASYSR